MKTSYVKKVLREGSRFHSSRKRLAALAAAALLGFGALFPQVAGATSFSGTLDENLLEAAKNGIFLGGDYCDQDGGNPNLVKGYFLGLDKTDNTYKIITVFTPGGSKGNDWFNTFEEAAHPDTILEHAIVTQVSQILTEEELKIFNGGTIDEEGNQTIKGNSTIDKDQTIKGDQTTEGDSTTKGDSNVDGDSDVTGDHHVGGDQDVDGNGNIGGDLDVGHHQTVGNGEEGDGQTINGDQQINGDQTIDGNQDITGNSHIGGNQTIDGWLNVKGETDLDGDLYVDGTTHLKDTDISGDLYLDGNQTTTGNQHTMGNETVDGWLNVKGETDLDGDLYVDGTTHLKDTDISGNLNVDGNQTTTGNSTVGGDGHFGGNLYVDGGLGVQGDEVVGGSLVVGKDFAVSGNSFTGGDSYTAGNSDVAGNGHYGGNLAVDGTLTASDVFLGNGLSVTQELSRQGTEIGEVAAGAAALAGLDYMPYEEGQKLSFAVGFGSYKSHQATALGAKYYFNKDVALNVASTLGYNENMISGGLSFRFGPGGHKAGQTGIDPMIAQKIAADDARIQELEAKNAEQEARIAKLEKMLEAMTTLTDGQ